MNFQRNIFRICNRIPILQIKWFDVANRWFLRESKSFQCCLELRSVKLRQLTFDDISRWNNIEMKGHRINVEVIWDECDGTSVFTRFLKQNYHYKCTASQIVQEFPSHGNSKQRYFPFQDLKWSCLKTHDLDKYNYVMSRARTLMIYNYRKNINKMT